MPASTWALSFSTISSALGDETSTLISCTGKITRTELAKLPTPPATATHIPIPHTAVVETLVETLSHRHIGVVGEEFAVSSDAMEMFGALDLETSFEGCRFAIGIRNANNKRFRLACTVGLRVFVCYNLAFRGDYSPVLARNTRRISRSKTPSRSAWTGCNGTLIQCGSRWKLGEQSNCQQKRQS
jgi:hypothetical protein